MTTNETAATETAAAKAGVAASGVAAGAHGGTSVSLRGLTRVFGATRALDQMSLEIAPGELVALLGPSGCGKTTALRIVAGFEFADAGEVLVDGKDVSGVPASRRDMGMVFQSYSLFPNMNALDNVAFGLRMRKVAGSARRKRAAAPARMSPKRGSASMAAIPPRYETKPIPISCKRNAPPSTKASAGLRGKSSPQTSAAISHSASI